MSRRRPEPLLAAAFARVGTGAAYTHIIPEAPVKITHPVKGYTGPVLAGDRRLFFVDGETEATGIKGVARRALEDAGFTVESTRTAQSEDTDAK
jgi:hypothetical protein